MVQQKNLRIHAHYDMLKQARAIFVQNQTTLPTYPKITSQSPNMSNNDEFNNKKY
jgi:hypothetical protein